MKRTRLKSANLERRAEMRTRNFPDRPAITPWCLVALALERYQARHGTKMIPHGWTSCWSGEPDTAHVVRARGMGGCNSSKDEVAYLCRGHHSEQEGRTEYFEAKYGIDLAAAAAHLAAGELGPESAVPA
jgi:hypothetical protein